MGNLYFYDIPVYRISMENYYEKRMAFVEENTTREAREAGGDSLDRQKRFLEGHHSQKYGSWDFNEIVGYIRLHFLGSQVRGEYFSAEKKRNFMSRNKVFTYRTHKLAIEINLRPPMHPSNADIWSSILKYIDACREELTRGRVVDDSNLRTIGPHIDWLGILGWSHAADASTLSQRD